MKKLFLLLFFASLFLSGCSAYRLAPYNEEPDLLRNCAYAERDLTVNWVDRHYWCDPQAQEQRYAPR